ncbi:hypothetical protein JXB31_04585 [Candidatus Woesearchaeota archaeon]|nr:hypothetical protein [Candidatus Woesearchaeota archaeon]
MYKRAQAAMEFLMTYGWAILVVLAAIGALAYFGVLSPGNLLPQRCEFSAGLDCTENPDASASGATITFPVTNSLGYKVQILTATSTGTGTCAGAATFSPATGELDNSANGIITLNGCAGLTAGDRYSDTVTITYRSNATGMTHSSVGRVAGKAR